MSRIRSAIAAGVMMSFLSMGHAAPELSKPVRIIAFGDSLTVGYNLMEPEREAWPALLEEKLRGKGYSVEIVNAGVSGETTYGALQRLDFTLAQGADIVIVEFGSNDIFHGKKLKDIELNLDEIVRRIKAKKMDVILCSLKTFPNLGKEYAGSYEKIFTRIAVKHKVTLAPFLLNNVAGNVELNLPDGIHPTAKGYKIVMENIYPTVEAAVKKHSAEVVR